MTLVSRSCFHASLKVSSSCWRCRGATAQSVRSPRSVDQSSPPLPSEAYRRPQPSSVRRALLRQRLRAKVYGRDPGHLAEQNSAPGSAPMACCRTLIRSFSFTPHLRPPEKRARRSTLRDGAG